MERLKLDSKLFAWLAGLLVIWLIFVSLIPIEYTPPANDRKVVVSFKVINGENTVLDTSKYFGIETNAFDAMQEVATVGYQDYGSLGVMIESINGVKPKEGDFWKLFIDGEQSNLGISAITIQKDTQIEWRTEAINEHLN